MNDSPVLPEPYGKTFLWKALLGLIFLRPFVNEYAFMTVGGWYIFVLTLFSLLYLGALRERIFLPLSLNIWPVLFLLIILFSLFYSGYTGWSLLESYFFFPNIVIFYIASKITPGKQKQLINCIFISASLICLYAVYQYFVGFQRILDYLIRFEYSPYAQEILYKKRVFATFTSPNIFSSYIIMMLFVSVGLLLSNRGGRRFVYGSGTMVMVLALIYTKSLGAILTCIAVFILFMHYLLESFNLGKSVKSLLRVTFVILAAGAALTIGFFLSNRLDQFFDPYRSDNSIIQRFYYWKASLNMFEGSPFTGIGWRKFGLLYECYKPSFANISHYAHNVFLQIMAETGLLGLAGFLPIVVMFLRSGWKILRGQHDNQRLKIGLFCAGCAFLAHNMIDLSFYFGQAAFFWWIIAGLFSNFYFEDSRGSQQV